MVTVHNKLKEKVSFNMLRSKQEAASDGDAHSLGVLCRLTDWAT